MALAYPATTLICPPTFAHPTSIANSFGARSRTHAPIRARSGSSSSSRMIAAASAAGFRGGTSTRLRRP